MGDIYIANHVWKTLSKLKKHVTKIDMKTIKLFYPQAAPNYSLSEHGGSWGSSKSNCRVSDRDSHWTDWRFKFIGFRLALSE